MPQHMHINTAPDAYGVEPDFDRMRRPAPDRVRILSKLDRSAGQIAAWVRYDQRTLKYLNEEFGHSPFTAKMAEECSYLEHERIGVGITLQRQVDAGWYELIGEEYILTEAGHDRYERDHPNIVPIL